MTDHASAQQSLINVYASHPLREETILARIVRQRGTLAGITEMDLAHDSRTEITDQNHVDGIVAVVQLALRAAVTAESRILDIGAGLGGSGRCLAHLFGCRVDGVELSPFRCAEANQLTARVHLDALVSCRCGDILSIAVPSHHYDVVWGQGAWTHIADTAALFKKAAGALLPVGRIAFEEPCLLRPPANAAEADTLAELERLWGGRLLSSGAWQRELEQAGFQGIAVDDVTAPFIAHFERLQTIARTCGADLYPAHETQAFAYAIQLARAGVVGHARLIGRRDASDVAKT